MRLAIAALLVLAIVSPGLSETYAERLGWRPTDRVLIMHADDGGMSIASTLGTIDALNRGIVSSTSLLMPCPAVPMMVDYLRKHPQVDAGVHLTFTSEHESYRWGPVADPSAVPGLCDRDGYLWDNVGLVLQHATADEIEREMRAQIARLERMGIRPTHIDTHMGTLVARADYLERYVKVAIEKQLPFMAFPYLESGDIDEQLLPLYHKLLKQAWNSGLPVLDSMLADPNGFKVGDRKAQWMKILRDMKPGVHFVLVHCSVPSADQVVLQGLSAASIWMDDYQAMVDPEVVRLIKDEGIILTTWRECKERRAKYGKPIP